MKTIKNLPEHERPREKLIEKGARALADHELLAVLLGKGSRKHDVISLAKKMIPVIDEKGEKLSITKNGDEKWCHISRKMVSHLA